MNRLHLNNQSRVYCSVGVSPLNASRTITTYSEHLFLSLRIVTDEKRHSRWDSHFKKIYTQILTWQINIIVRNKTLKGYLITNLKLYYITNNMSGGFFSNFSIWYFWPLYLKWLSCKDTWYHKLMKRGNPE